MVDIASHIIDITGPMCVVLLGYMLFFLIVNNAIKWNLFATYQVWPELVFRFRDFTKKRSGTTSSVYYLFWFSLITTLIFAVVSVLYEIDLKHPAVIIMVLIFGIVLFPVIFYIFYLYSKEEYY